MRTYCPTCQQVLTNTRVLRDCLRSCEHEYVSVRDITYLFFFHALLFFFCTFVCDLSILVVEVVKINNVFLMFAVLCSVFVLCWC